ncbi:MAG: type I-E CRISPR-associated protein Cas5/CasD [Candidatus Latescibacterota bacterium]
MSSDGQVLALLLRGPMQAWGACSRYGRRTTLAYPTRSAVTGLLCAAMGVERSDTGTLRALAGLAMEILVIARRWEALRWTDYHTVGAAYDRVRQRGFIPTIAKGGSRKDPVETWREYLSDVAFGVLVSGDQALVQRCDRALRDPQWGVWLGRKCCIPTDMVCQGLHASPEEAISRLVARTGGTVVRLVREVDRFEKGTDTLLDMPLDFALQDPSQRNLPRRIWVGRPEDLPEER